MKINNGLRANNKTFHCCCFVIKFLMIDVCAGTHKQIKSTV